MTSVYYIRSNLICMTHFTKSETQRNLCNAGERQKEHEMVNCQQIRNSDKLHNYDYHNRAYTKDCLENPPSDGGIAGGEK